MAFQILLQLTITGLAWGSVYACIALGFVLIFKSTDIFNFAQPELMMFGAYMSFTLVTHLRLPFLLGFLFCLVLMAVIAGLLEMMVVRPMVGEPVLSVIMVTLGLANVLRGCVGLVWGYEELQFPSPFSQEPILLFGAAINQAEVFTILATAILLVIFFLFFKYSGSGISMRATAEDTTTAFLMGINVKRVFTASWVIATVVATISGVFLASFTFLEPIMGFTGLKALPAIILGGLDSIHGAIIGGLIIGVAENLAGFYLEDYLGAGINEITAYVIVLIVMMVRPYGLFGSKEIERV
ncbi:MAG: branched-chain amino acid ABC transporter permease [Desulfatiglans sp.]|jgi:branched-chain amino acid transport system permease protein|nr:branched-chain amino acid ABC transporter permease [Thermodesulfobacteriota bacterium]MEE4352298.1 branched-chain amino acid ABC transporter permease [Desulfatiglans sp.]